MKHKLRLSRYADDALRLFGALVHAARIEQQVTQQALADRAGISRALLARIERGDAGCAIGSAFEVAAILRIPLFHADGNTLAVATDRAIDRTALLPSAVRQPRAQHVSDDS